MTAMAAGKHVVTPLLCSLHMLYEGKQSLLILLECFFCIPPGV